MFIHKTGPFINNYCASSKEQLPLDHSKKRKSTLHVRTPN